MSPAADPCLVVFARAPIPGQVKTRLCGEGGLSGEEAAQLHQAFTLDVLCAGQGSGIPRRCLYAAGGADHPFLVDAAARHGYALKAQGEGDLGARMDAAITAELAAGAGAVVLVGTDSPALTPALLGEAASLLRAADVVLGPACDGGYWLVGARRPVPALFAPPMSWGTGAVLVATLGRLHRLSQEGLLVRLLPFFYDVDTPADLALLRADLRLRQDAAARHTRQALARIATPS